MQEQNRSMVDVLQGLKRENDEMATIIENHKNITLIVQDTLCRIYEHLNDDHFCECNFCMTALRNISSTDYNFI